MSRFADQPVLRVPPQSTAGLERLANATVGQLCPQMLERPGPLPVLELFEEILPGFNIHTYPVDDCELPDEEAATEWQGAAKDPIHILIRDNHFANLVHGRRRANFPKSTLCHELGHALLHVPVLRRRASNPETRHLLQRRSQGEVKAYESSEWQAWTFGGAILMPVHTLRMLPDLDLMRISDTFEVSTNAAQSHLKRMKNAGLV